MSNSTPQSRLTAALINEYLYGDSQITIPMPDIEAALLKDVESNGGVWPCEDDMENIVMPEDEGDEETNKRFPNLIALISAQF